MYKKKKQYTYTLKGQKITVSAVDYDHQWHTQEVFLQKFSADPALKVQLWEMYNNSVDLRLSMYGENGWRIKEEDEWNKKSKLIFEQIEQKQKELKKLKQDKMKIKKILQFSENQETKQPIIRRRPASGSANNSIIILKDTTEKSKSYIYGDMSNEYDVKLCGLNENIKNVNTELSTLFLERSKHYQNIYLNSNWWKFRRSRFIVKKFVSNDGKLYCSRCYRRIYNLSDIDVHHVKYRRNIFGIVVSSLFGEYDFELAILCGDCHMKEHNIIK